jgi:nicotinate-nucleotide--dimethylbenzimidazole phosphoribosyltransferase
MTILPVLAEAVELISPPAPRYFDEAHKRLDRLTKPVGSLGQIETIAAQMVAIQSGAGDFPLKKAAYIFAADHAVTSEGVSAYPKEVTAQMVHNFLRGGAAINVLARLHQVELTVVDVGVDAEFGDNVGLHRAKIRHGSRNLLREPAMSHEELSGALRVGLDMAERANDRGQHLIAVGEMGIGNTTAASAITALITGQQVADVTGRGAGLDDAGRNRKLHVIRKALKRHFADLSSRPDPTEILRCVGGLEIAAMTGFVLGAARYRRAIICDGFISTAAAAVAYAIAPQIKDYLFAGHCSEEPGHRHLLRYLGVRSILNLGMRLGEGTGAVLAMPIIESALRLYCEMATFASAGVSEAKA